MIEVPYKKRNESKIKVMKLLFYLYMNKYLDDELIQIYKENKDLLLKIEE
jgi:hypothetical protein